MNLPRTPYDKIHGLVYFGRMLDKIRLHAAGKLPADYIANLGEKFDGACLRFLGVEYAPLVAIVTAGASSTFAIRNDDLSQCTQLQTDLSNHACMKHTPPVFKNQFESKSLQNIIHSNNESRASDEAAWEWCQKNGKPHTKEEIMIWNTFMMKSGWRDDASEMLQRRLKEGGWENRSDIQTFFDFLDLDEGRELKAGRWKMEDGR